MTKFSLKKLNMVLIATCLLFMLSIQVLAADPGRIDLNARGSITVQLVDADHRPVTGGKVALLQIATVVDQGGNDQYAWLPAFSSSGLDLDDLLNDGFASDVASYASAQGLTGDVRDVGSDGRVVYADLPVGIYLVTQPEADPMWYPFQPYLVTLPLNQNDVWVYEVDSLPKMEPLQPVPPTPTPVPPTPTPGGKPTPTPTPTCTPTPTPGGSPSPTVTPTPTGNPGGDTSGGHRLPQTGQLNWPIPVLAFFGLLQVIIGLAIRQSGKREEENADFDQKSTPHSKE